MTTTYQQFLDRKTQLENNGGFKPVFMPDFLFDFQKALVEWAIVKGRAAVFADCGLGKTLMQLVWAQNVVEKTNRRVLILTPLAVAAQTVKEAKQFGIDAERSRDGTLPAAKIVVTNYQQLSKFSPHDFVAVACDESSILKNFDGKIKSEVTEFVRKLQFRSLWTATAAPNDYIELGTSSEALGNLGFVDMLNIFFKKAESTMSRSEEFRAGIYRFRGHSENNFWRWVCSWARAVRKPSDIGFSDENHKLTKLITVEHIVKSRTSNPDFLFDMPACGLSEQRKERRRTIEERCELAASLINSHKNPSVAWCHLNDEGKFLEKMIDGAVEIDGNDSDDFKEEVFENFQDGKIRVLVSKPVIAGFGLNWQHCYHQTFFPSHSYEQWYQAIRRSWRFGQKSDVKIDVISSEGEADVLLNMNRKSAQAETMFQKLVSLINNEINIEQTNKHTQQLEKPSWL